MPDHAPDEAPAVDTLTRLAAIEDIKQLKARYMRGVDTKDWALFRSVFTDDAVVDNSQSARELRPDEQRALPPPPHPEDAVVPGWAGIDAFIDYVRAATEGGWSVHFGIVPEITVLSPTEATGVWKMEDVVTWDRNGGERSPRADTRHAGVRRLHGHGYYRERYRKEAGTWRIAYRRLTRILLDLEREA